MKKYEIIKANVKIDKKDILSILKRNLEGITEKRYDWNYLNCPYGRAQCLLAKDNTSKSYIGSAALFQREVSVDDKTVFSGITGDFAVDKKHRAFGPAFQIQRQIQHEVNNGEYEFVYGVPNKLSKMLFLKIGYKEVGKFRQYVKILKIDFMPKEYLPSILHYKFFAKMGNIYFKLISREKRYRSNNYSVETPDAFDKRFDALWKKVEEQHEIVGKRKSKFLNWRYNKSSLYDYKIFCIADEKKEIVGYVVYFVKDNICHIVDMLFVKSDEVINSLLFEFVRFMRKDKIGSIAVRYLGNSYLKEKLKKHKFLVTKKEELNGVFICSKNNSKFDLLNEEKWHFFEGDNDV